MTLKLLAAAFVVVSFVLTASAGMAAGGGQAQPAGVSLYENTIAGSSLSLGLQAGYGIRLWDGPDIDMVQVLPSVTFPISGVRGRSWFRGIWEYKIEGVLGTITNLNDRGEIGLCPVGLKYNFTGLGGRLVPYAEVLLGAVYLDVPRDVQGTRFNFLESGGLGAQYFVSKGTALNFQVRYGHISNAGIREPNKGINEGFLLAGMSFY